MKTVAFVLGWVWGLGLFVIFCGGHDPLPVQAPAPVPECKQCKGCEPLLFQRRHDATPKCGAFVEWHMDGALIEGTDGVWYLVRTQEILTTYKRAEGADK